MELFTYLNAENYSYRHVHIAKEIKDNHRKVNIICAVLLMMMLLVNFWFGLSSVKNFFDNKDLHKIKLPITVDIDHAMQGYIFPENPVLNTQSSDLDEMDDFINVVSMKDYNIKSGDSISTIASKFGLKNIGTLISLNNLENAKKLKIGQTLIIPSMDGIMHTVRKNESLSSIASKYKISLSVLVDANNIDTEIVQINSKLFIPGGTLSNYEIKKALGELFIYPLNGRLTSYFGYRKDPFTGVRSYHSGIDLAAPQGTPIKCIMDGKVAEIGQSAVYGNYIIITHDGGYQSMYGHLSTVNVKRSQVVSQGTKIGTVGTTGRSTGPHLHLNIYKNGKLINPLSVLQ